MTSDKGFTKNKQYFFKNSFYFLLGVVLPFLLLLNSGQKYSIVSISKTESIKKQSTASTTSNLTYITKELLSISKTPYGQESVRDKLLVKLNPEDPNSIFTIVDSIEANKTLVLNCHEIAHDIGHEAYELYGFKGAMNFTDSARLNHSSISDICAGGYVHGVLEKMAVDDSNFKDIISTVCTTVAKSDEASCFHGIGHALMFSYDRDINASLTSCRSIGIPTSASRCFEGVWMELFWGLPQFGSSTNPGFDVERPFAPCVTTQNDAKPACFLYSSFGYLRNHKKDYNGAIRLCTKNNLNENDVDFCLKGVGITMNSNFKAKNLERSESFVEGMSSLRKRAFYQGVFGYADLSGIGKPELKIMCESFKHDSDICNDVVDEIN